jgi:hypothetical protein
MTGRRGSAFASFGHAAKTLGLAVPETLLVEADEVID